MKYFPVLWTAASISLASAKSLWSSSPASASNLIQTAYTIGNGRLGAMPAGIPGADVVNLNVDSLWSGGPFENTSYSGGNPPSSVYQALSGIRDWIFQNGTGNVSQLLGGEYSYGSNMVLADLTVQLEGVQNTSSYRRNLDLDTALHTTDFESNGKKFTTTVFCSYLDGVCVYSVNSTSALPNITIGIENMLMNSSLYNVTCSNGSLAFHGVTSEPGMKFYSMVKALTNTKTTCSGNSLLIPASAGAKSFTIVVGADTNYDQTKGSKAYNYSFEGVDPAPLVQSTIGVATGRTLGQLVDDHIKEYQSYFNTFTLDLPNPDLSATEETASLIAAYNTSIGNPFVESLLFDYGRYLFISSSRDNSLPPNLQGRWTTDVSSAWGADYHADINLQMNHWAVPQTGLGPLQTALWKYMKNTWVPYGEVTASLLYNASSGGAWVVHDEMNIFGYTAMKESAQWADYPVAAAWMMHHVSDWFDYSRDVSWYQATGYPLLKGIASFWLSQLQEDLYFNDGTLVVNPCNSPEHGPTTFGCTHYQQLLWELFDRILATWPESGDTDATFRHAVASALAKLDNGVHIGKWGQLQEWKMDMDVENDTHRHLSGLYGWYPGYSVAGPFGANQTVRDAVETMLWSRGPGNGPDANAGWEKVWRAACWAGLNDTDQAFFELSYAIDQNFAPNALSMYSGTGPPFQIDANFGIVGAVISMLSRDLPQAHGDGGEHFVVLGPAIPASWKGGTVKGLRLRGGGMVDFSWTDEGVVDKASLRERTLPVRLLNVNGQVITTK